MAVLPRSRLLNCTAMVAYVYHLHFPPHYGDNVKVKSQHIRQAIPALLRGLMKQWLQMTGAYVIAYDALHMKI